MKLYYKTGACALSPHIVMAELNMVYEIEAVDLAAKTTANGDDYRKINPKGAVPALRMENGEILTEGAVICQYLADQKNGALLGKSGTTERYRTMEWMNYIATEIHKGFNPLFSAERWVTNPEGLNELKTNLKIGLNTKFQYISDRLGTNNYLMGSEFTIADAYMFTCLNWTKFVGMDLTKWPNLTSYMNRMSERPAVQRAMKESGMLK